MPENLPVLHKPYTTQIREFLVQAANDTQLISSMADLFLMAMARPEALQPEFTKFYGPDWAKTMRSRYSVESLRQTSLELVICRLTDGFEYYLSSILRRIFIERPETLRSSNSTISYKDVMDLGGPDAFVAWAADKKATDLCFEGIRDAIRKLEREYNLKVSIDEKDFADACEFLEIRNIIVHNNCRVSELFLRRTKKTGLTKDKVFVLDQTVSLHLSYALMALAAAIDKAAIEHFNLTPLEG